MFQPVTAGGGLLGWRLLNRTRDTQMKVLASSAETRNLTDYFRKNIKSVKSGADLVDDRRLLTVALKAFGLEGDINSKAFIRKILDDGTVSDKALSNRLADKRYLAFAQAFGFKDLPIPRTQLTTFPDEIINRYVATSFESAVGETDGDMRLALGFSSGVSDVLTQQRTANGRWFAVMGNAPLRKVFESALGLPSSIGRLDLDQQLTAFRTGMARLTGQTEVAAAADPKVQDQIIRTFLIRSQAQSQPNSVLSLLSR